MGKDKEWFWSDAAGVAFERLNRALVEAPVLRLPDFSKFFLVRTDGSAVAIGAILI